MKDLFETWRCDDSRCGIGVDHPGLYWTPSASTTARFDPASKHPVPAPTCGIPGAAYGAAVR